MASPSTTIPCPLSLCIIPMEALSLSRSSSTPAPFLTMALSSSSTLDRRLARSWIIPSERESISPRVILILGMP